MKSVESDSINISIFRHYLFAQIVLSEIQQEYPIPALVSIANALFFERSF